MILETLCSIALFINGGHVIDTKLGLHHYSDEDYKEIFFLENKDLITKNCIRHSKIEDVKKIIYYSPNEDSGEMFEKYKIHDPYPYQSAPQQDTFNSQRMND
tara:strand:+ start:1722 stop:2027 length:306 start_codon:yes stop_codon:yes gene_type:complete